MTIDVVQLGAAAGIGLLAGLLGGIAGVGGSILILPSLGMIFGYPRDSTHHLYMAAAMSVNLVVALPAAWRHHKHKAVRRDLFRVLAPVTAIMLALGVLASNVFRGWQLQLLLSAFLVVYSFTLVRAMLCRHADHAPEAEHVTTPRLVGSASVTGFAAGLLGLGGGVLQVPLLQVLCRVPLRQAIGTSAAVMCVTAMIGAGLKLATLAGEGESAVQALLLALMMAPTAVFGARLGAGLTHALPIHAVRGVITVMLLISAWRLAVAGGRMAGWW